MAALSPGTLAHLASVGPRGEDISGEPQMDANAPSQVTLCTTETSMEIRTLPGARWAQKDSEKQKPLQPGETASS